MAKEKLLLPMILLSTACFGLAPDIENLVSNQDEIVAAHESQVKDFVLKAELNSHERQHAVQEIINNSQKNVGCDVTLCKWIFPKIDSNKDQANINMEEQKLYIFVSLSMPPASLLALLKDNHISVLPLSQHDLQKPNAGFL